MQTLPSPIRHYLAQGRYSVVAKNLTFKYQLRIDQGGILEREIMLLLMGVESPDDFVNSLKSEATLPEETVFSIMTDVNQEIFAPLQEEMRKGETRASEPASPAVSRAHLEAAIPPMTPRHIINKIPVSPATPRQIVSDNKLLEDHEEPHIEFTQAPMAPPARSVPISSPPRPTMPPPNLPGAPRPSENVSGGVVGIPPVPPKPYLSDPYREPIDEKE